MEAQAHGPRGPDGAEQQPGAQSPVQTPEWVGQYRPTRRTGERLKRLFMTVSEKAQGSAKSGLMRGGGVWKEESTEKKTNNNK